MPTSRSLSPRARALVQTRPVFDAHVDSLQRQLDLEHDLGLRTAGHLDLVRGREGGLGSMVFVNWVDPKYIAPEQGGANRRTRELLREFHRLLRAHPDELAFAGNGRLLREARAAGKLAGIPGIEGGHSLEERLEELVWFFEHGVRVLTLVWNNHLSWIRSCQPGAGEGVPAGLSGFGRSVVSTMNELGMLVDLSHAGERAFYDALETTTKPVIASHSGCKALHGHQRNLDDEQLRALKRNGGVVGIVFCVPFLSPAGQAEDARWRESEGYKALEGRNATELFLRQGEYLQEQAEPLPIEVLVEHVEHAVEVAGIEHVGLGSDFDGILRTPQGLEDASCYGNLVEQLLARGFGEDEVLAICGGNMQRVFEEATGAGTRAATAELAALED